MSLAPAAGWRAWVVDEGTGILHDGAGWRVDAATSADMLGIQCHGQARPSGWPCPRRRALFTHEGGGHPIKPNKAAPGETASLLFQTGWSARAEFGTTGDHDLAIKVSPDGVDWQTALTAERRAAPSPSVSRYGFRSITPPP